MVSYDLIVSRNVYSDPSWSPRIQTQGPFFLCKAVILQTEAELLPEKRCVAHLTGEVYVLPHHCFLVLILPHQLLTALLFSGCCFPRFTRGHKASRGNVIRHIVNRYSKWSKKPQLVVEVHLITFSLQIIAIAGSCSHLAQMAIAISFHPLPLVNILSPEVSSAQGTQVLCLSISECHACREQVLQTSDSHIKTILDL